MYEIIGDDKNVISTKALFECLKDSLLINNGSNFKINSEMTKMIDTEVEEIIKIFSKDDSDFISIEDFVNILISE